jgi:hypothetical protein
MKLKVKMKAEGNSGEVVSAIRPGMKKVADMIAANSGSSDSPVSGPGMKKKLKLKVK